jgi:hypothetical protein
MHHTIILVVLALTASELLSSCVTGDSNRRPEGVVVERNKQLRPAWVDSPPDKLLVNSTETRFHFALLKQRDLPIAVKLSQTKAVEASFNLWLSGFEQRLADFPQINGLRSSPKMSKDMEGLITNVAHKIHSQVAQIEDIYYERVRIDNYKPVPELEGVTEYFDVHTLIQLLPVDGDKLRVALGSALSSGKFQEMKKVGRELNPPLERKRK